MSPAERNATAVEIDEATTSLSRARAAVESGSIVRAAEHLRVVKRAVADALARVDLDLKRKREQSRKEAE